MPIEIIPHGTNIDFIGKRHICAAISAVLILSGLVASVVKGVEFGIDFAGGTELHAKFLNEEPVDEGVLRELLTALPSIKDVSVVRFGAETDREFLIRFQNAEIEEESVDAEELAGGIHSDRVSAVEKTLVGAIGGYRRERVDFVGPRVGSELRTDGAKALGIAALLILAYIAFRFNSRFAPGAIVAVIHDLLITAGIFVIFGFEFDLRILAAMLAILGYSLNDTIIIYDRIRENLERRTAYDLPTVLNQSVNQTLSRTTLTSVTTFGAVLALGMLGGDVIRPFAIAMLIGVVVGTYSSIYIAAPTLMFLEERYGEASS